MIVGPIGSDGLAPHPILGVAAWRSAAKFTRDPVGTLYEAYFFQAVPVRGNIHEMVKLAMPESVR